jgi:hypothetical protein
MELLGDLAYLESRFGPFEDVVSVGARLHGLRRTYHRLRYRIGRTQWLRDEAQVEARFGPFRDSANLDARSVHGLRQMYHRLGNHFRLTRWNF